MTSASTELSETGTPPRLRILHVAQVFYPATAFGGPIVSTLGLCNALAAQHGVHLEVLTTDAAGPSPSQRLSLPSNPLKFPAGFDVHYTRRIMGKEVAPGLFARLLPAMLRSDVVLLTGAYSLSTLPCLAAARLTGRPVMWSPRGALQASDLWKDASNQRLKRVWERMCAAVLPRERTVLHVTSEEERRATLARLPGLEAVVIPNGIAVPEETAVRSWPSDGPLRLMFIGRLNPIKALEQLIRAMALLPAGVCTLDIYGQGEPAYVAGLEAEVGRLQLGDAIAFHGHVDGADKQAAFARAHACILPSFTENFGMVVAEALASAIPVIASTGTPWRELDARGCGLWVENSPESLANAITQLRQGDLEAMGGRGRAWMAEAYGWDRLAAQTLQVMRQLVDRTNRKVLSHADLAHHGIRGTRK